MKVLKYQHLVAECDKCLLLQLKFSSVVHGIDFVASEVFVSGVSARLLEHNNVMEKWFIFIPLVSVESPHGNDN